MTLCSKFEIHYLFNDISVSLLFIFISYVILYEYFCLHFLHCMWLRCIRSCTKDPSHGFFVNRWFVHYRFKDLGNPLEVVVHYFLIKGMNSFGHRDGFSIMRVLVCMVTYWIRPTGSYDIRLSSSYEFTKLLHCVVSQPWNNTEFLLKLAIILMYQWDYKLIIYSLCIESLSKEADNNGYSQ